MTQCYCDADTPDVYTQKTVKARKPHKCHECRRAIETGEKYERTFYTYDRTPYVHKTCEMCVDLREFVQASIPCFCWFHETLHENSIEAAQQYSHEAPGFLFGVYRKIVTINKRIRK